MACDPQTLFTAASCLACLAPGQLQILNTYLLIQIAGMAVDIQTLLTDAGCLECLTPGQHQLLQTYLLCNIVSGGGGTQQVYTGAAPPAAPLNPAQPAIWFPTGGGAIKEWTGVAWV